MPKDFEEKQNFDTYIYSVLKQVHPDTGINDHARTSMNVMLHDIARHLCARMATLNRDGVKRTISSREVQTAVRLHLPGETAKHAVSEGTKAVTKFTSSDGGSKSNPRSHAARAGLQFPPSRVRHLMKKYIPGVTRIGSGAPVYFAAVLEYLCAEVIELSGDACKDQRKQRITREHLMFAIKGDQELDKIFKGTIVMGSIPAIHRSLMPKKK